MTDLNIAAALTAQPARNNAAASSQQVNFGASAEPAQEKFNAVMARANERNAERNAERKPVKQATADNSQRTQQNQATMPAQARNGTKQTGNESGAKDTVVDETDSDATQTTAEEQEQVNAIVALLPNEQTTAQASESAALSVTTVLVNAAVAPNAENTESTAAGELNALATDATLVSADAVLKAKIAGSTEKQLATTANTAADAALTLQTAAAERSASKLAADQTAASEHSFSKALLRDLDQGETLKSSATLRAEAAGAALAAQAAQRELPSVQQLNLLTAAPSAVRIDAALAPVQPSYTVAHASIATPVHAPGFAHDFANRIVTFTSQRVHSAEIDLNPAELGPVSVSIELRGSEASLAFGANAAATRAAIEDALPRLREMLAAQGMQLAQSSVGEHARQQWSQGNSQSNSQETSGGNSGRQQGNGTGRGNLADGQRIEPASTVAASRGRYLIDVRV